MGEGRLDPSVQNGEVRVAVQTRKERKIVEIGLGGNVRTIDVDPPAAPVPAKAAKPGATPPTPTGSKTHSDRQ